MDKRITLTEVLWVCYGTLMLISLDVVFDNRHWAGAFPSLVMTGLFFICFLVVYKKKLSISMGWFFGLYLVLSVFFYFLLATPLFILALNGLGYLLIIKFLYEKKEAEFYWQCFFYYSFGIIILLMIALLCIPRLTVPYALLGFIVLVLIIQLALIVLKEGQGIGIGITAKVSGLFFSGALIIGAIIWFMRPVLRFVIAATGMAIAWLTIHIEMFIIYLISLMASNQAKKKAHSLMLQMTTQKKANHFVKAAHHQTDFLFWVGMILLSVFVIGIFYFLSKRHLRFKGEIGASSTFQSAALERPLKKPGRDGVKAHKHPVRKSVFRLQKWAVKQKIGRLSHLTLSDWLKTLDVTREQAGLLSAYYGKVRYGGQELTEEEWGQFQQSLTKVKDQMKKAQGKDKKK